MKLKKSGFFFFLLFQNYLYGSNFQVGNCKLSKPIDLYFKEDLNTLYCVKGNGIFDVSKGVNHDDTINATVLNGYFSAHRGLHSFHLRNRLEGYQHSEKNNGTLLSEIPLLAYQYGKIPYQSFQFTLGKIRPPFGYEPYFIDGFYNIYNTETFWPTEQNGIVLTYDDQNFFRAELGATSTRNDLIENRMDDLFSIRLSFDYPALEGSRVLLSFTENKKNLKTYGATLLNKQLNKHLFYMEWVRQSENHYLGFATFDQLVRIAYEKKDLKTTSKILIDDIRSKAFLLTFQQKFLWENPHLSKLGLSLAFTYQRQKFPSRVMWSTVMGLFFEL